ncbi:MAG: aldehyde ferredoxin oxidoreductase family protein [Deltaproteobacteria bacterium]|nr:aldehyde ferredoxin oxidoreductase family protein [Deltaproteobacteria bacterium]
MKGFFNRVLKIDVGEQSFSIQEISDQDLEQGLGGKGLGTRLLMANNPAGVDPLAADNHLIIAVGPVTDSPIYGSCRHGIFTKSPQTGFYAESYSGGKAAESISRTGYDAILIRGVSKEPVFLEINDETVHFHPAQDLWGLDTYAAEDEVLKRIGKKRMGTPAERAAALVIGPAGENLVRFSVIENDYWRSAGRTGTGAVMGSKKIKALCFYGLQKRPLAFPDEVKAFAQEILEKGKTDAGVANYRKMGTPMMVGVLNKAQAFPTQYWSKGVLEGWEAIGADSLHERCEVQPRACARCFIACGRLSKVKEGPHKGMTLEGPEYETIYAFGGLCLIKSIEDILYLNDICDRLGLDTITAGNLAGLAIEASKRGKIPEKIEYGDVPAIAALLKQIAYRQGIGAVLAEGIKTAAAEWGLEDIAIHVKGLEPAGYDPRVLKGVGLGYATSDRGACHLRATFYKPELSRMIDPDQLEGKAELFIDFEDRLCLFDTLILCRFYRDLYPWPELSRIIHMTTGLTWGKEEIHQMANRVITLCREFNLREGMTPDLDALPVRFHKEALPESGKVITEDELNYLVKDYYRLRGWN